VIGAEVAAPCAEAWGGVTIAPSTTGSRRLTLVLILELRFEHRQR
jgi:hypothetical protein